MLGFPQSKEDLDEKETIYGGTDCPNFAESGDDTQRRHGTAAWRLRTIHLSVEAPVWAD